MNPVATFSVNYSQLLDEKGNLNGELDGFLCDTANQLKLYRNMLMTRIFDQKAISLQRTGRLGTYASTLGQESVPTAIGFAMQPEDVLAPMYREYAAMFCRGVRPSDILLYWGGDERGMAFRNNPDSRDLPICVPIASQACHAAGVAYAFKLRKQEHVVVCVIGDGATSKGDFYEALNAAGVWNLPLIFVVHNNQWAISVPRSRQSAAQTLAQKAIAAGIPSEQIDGNDVFGCYQAISAAIESARQGRGPYLIEALSYRLSNHTTADDASRYREESDVEQARNNEPLVRLRQYLLSTGSADENELETIEKQCEAYVEQEVNEYLATEKQDATSIIDYLYEKLPDVYLSQRSEIAGKGECDD